MKEEDKTRRELLDAIDRAEDPATKSEKFRQYLAYMYNKIKKELDEEVRGERPFRCGWFADKVKERRARMEGKEYVPDDENLPDDKQIGIILKDGREFWGTRGEAKKWLKENGIEG